MERNLVISSGLPQSGFERTRIGSPSVGNDSKRQRLRVQVLDESSRDKSLISERGNTFKQILQRLQQNHLRERTISDELRHERSAIWCMLTMAYDLSGMQHLTPITVPTHATTCFCVLDALSLLLSFFSKRPKTPCGEGSDMVSVGLEEENINRSF